jgi:hypothetical protein
MTTIVQLLDSEVARLNDRKTAIDNAEEERKRVISLTTSAVERQKAYNNLYIVLVIMLVIVVFIKLLYQFELVPNTLLDVIITFVIAGGLIYSIMLYDDIEKRSKFDFSQINLGKIPVKSQDQIDKDFKSGNLGAIASNNQQGKCNGAGCCTSDQTYNEKYSVCVPNVIPMGTVATAGNVANSIKYGSNGANITTYPNAENLPTTLTATIIEALIEAPNYKYCRIGNDDYEWLPVTLFNLMPNAGLTALVRVMPTDPNWVGTGRLTYVPETLSTNPVVQAPLVQAFTTMESKSAITTGAYAKYV